MKPNYLYSLLANHPLVLPESLIEHATTLEKQKYYRIGLPVNPRANPGFKIKEAHLSIYETIDPLVPELGPSHITLFMEAQNEKFRLHIFLNEKDELACSPHWHRWEANGDFNRVDPPQDIDNLLSISLQSAFPILRTLRQEQRTIITALTQSYNITNETLDGLFQTIAENQGKNEVLEEITFAYLNTLEETEKLLKQLRNLSWDSKWQRLHNVTAKILQKEQQSRQQMLLAAEDTEPCSGELEEGNENYQESESEVGPLLEQPLSIKRKSRPRETLISQFEKLCDDVNQSPAASENAIIVQLNKINQALLFIDFDKEQHSLATLSQLKKIEEKTNYIAKELLQKWLLASQFHKFARLSHFSASLDLHDLMTIGLQNHNSELLRFLIHTFSIPVNTFPITIDETYPSALEYCISTHSKKNPMIDCAAVLVEKGADLLLPYSKNGLPIAHFILCEGSKHPLFKILEINCKQTLENKNFYEQLIAVLHTYLQTPELSRGRAQTAKKAIQKYQNAAETCKHLSYFYFTAKNYQDAVMDSYQFKDEVIERFVNDEDVIAFQQNIVATLALYKNEWTKSHFGKSRPFPLASVKLKSDTELCADYIKKSPALGIGAVYTLDIIDTLKSQFFSAYTPVQDYLMAARRLLVVQDQLVRMINYKRPTKKYKQLAAQEQTLLKEMKELEPQLPLNVIKNFAIQSSTEINKAIGTTPTISTLLAQFGQFSSIPECPDDNELLVQLSNLVNAPEFPGDILGSGSQDNKKECCIM